MFTFAFTSVTLIYFLGEIEDYLLFNCAISMVKVKRAFKGALMQILKSPYMLEFIKTIPWKFRILDA